MRAIRLLAAVMMDDKIIARMKKLLVITALAVTLPLGAYLVHVAKLIEMQSLEDEAQPADVILVLGAAEYRGKPSPVLRARLDHALSLYMRGMAPRIITSGGAGGDPVFTEAEVSRDYLTMRGLPSEAIILEPNGDSTVHSIMAVAEILRRMNLHTVILVSDGYHIFRAKRILEFEGFTAYGSPRLMPTQGTLRERWLYLRQAFGYVLWRAHVNI
jgi:uncharacterized SAM-binding protein YcdF (DUF218 family)